ncbi:MAG: hypothetical protein A3K61_06685 [Thaumarchaeota archaeon RBG_16_49_8]|nr:hypothetical protein [Nitrososphaerota archaeon]OHE53835.1 MAG: hypothetical protein A3K61_06685 [Thaumarchaeota archaeon RBG_16_49_8]
MEDEVSHFFTMIGHPLRRKIIKYLGENGQGGFTDLKAYLNVSTGTLYYQIDFLTELIEQDDAKKYRLNEKGKFAYQLLSESYEKLTSSRFVKRDQTVAGYITLWLIGWRFISNLYARPRLASLFAAMVLLYGTLIAYLSGLYPLIFIYVNRLPISPLYIPLLFILGYLLINALANLLSFVAYRTQGGAKPLLLGSAFALAPSLIAPTVYVIAEGFQTHLTSLQIQILMLIGVGYSLGFLTSAISLSKGLATEKAALLASITLYVSLGLAYFFTTL